jgi:broad specificity phosphatase PhoE
MQTKLILIRHGETFANRQKRYIGRTESRITSYGKYQARCLQKRISTGVIDKILQALQGGRLILRRLSLQKSKFRRFRIAGDEFWNF